MENLKLDNSPWEDLPVGTKVFAIGKGYWQKKEDGSLPWTEDNTISQVISLPEEEKDEKPLVDQEIEFMVNLIMKVIGPIQPQGASHIDGMRYLSLKNLCCLVDALIEEIKSVSEHKEDHLYSMKMAGIFAHNYLWKNFGITDKPNQAE